MVGGVWQPAGADGSVGPVALLLWHGSADGLDPTRFLPVASCRAALLCLSELERRCGCAWQCGARLAACTACLNSSCRAPVTARRPAGPAQHGGGDRARPAPAGQAHRAEPPPEPPGQAQPQAAGQLQGEAGSEAPAQLPSSWELSTGCAGRLLLPHEESAPPLCLAGLHVQPPPCSPAALGAQVGLGLGLKWGRGLLVAKAASQGSKGAAWSPPVLFKMSEASVGVTAGARLPPERAVPRADAWHAWSAPACCGLQRHTCQR